MVESGTYVHSQGIDWHTDGGWAWFSVNGMAVEKEVLTDGPGGPTLPAAPGKPVAPYGEKREALVNLVVSDWEA